jgi:fructose-1,6-bisphosphatase/sedoheptulose 1,7-bisphosphatase-like protein
LSQTQFNNEQIQVLALGLNYAIAKNPQSYINQLIVETESAIRKLDTMLQNPYRYMAAVKIKQIADTQTMHKSRKKIQCTVKEIREILHRDKLTVKEN